MDGVAGTFEPGAVVDVPDHIAEGLLRTPGLWELAPAPEAAPDAAPAADTSTKKGGK